MSSRYAHSERLLERALGAIPLGSQTFSKSHVQYPHGVSPYFLSRGVGSHVWDVDGNEYIDFVSGLASISLGYADPDVTAAVRRQIDNGTIFSLGHSLEIETAEAIIRMVPCAEMVRFGKNGSDATAGAVRAARAYTSRDYVAVCGYHGWQDWYIGSTARRRGVPKAVSDLTLPFTYNDLPSLEAIFAAHPGDIAAVILEPMNAVDPAPGFLQGVRDLATRHGAVLIFDEMVTGFRLAKGGAQEHFGVMPDLAAFGKAIANGYPLSAVAGRRDIMRMFEEVFFSFTMGGETLSLAAGLATLTKLETAPVIDTLYERGRQLQSGLRDLISRHRMDDILSTSGNPSWTFINFKDVNSYSLWEIKTLWMQEILERGILSLGTHNLTYAHSAADIERLLAVYDEVFPVLRDAVQERKMRQLLRCKPLEPLFRVR